MTAFGLYFVGDGLKATQGLAMAGLALNISMLLIPGIVALIGFIIWVIYYPLTGEKVKEMKAELAKIHEEKRKSYETEHQN